MSTTKKVHTCIFLPLYLANMVEGVGEPGEIVNRRGSGDEQHSARDKLVNKNRFGMMQIYRVRQY